MWLDVFMQELSYEEIVQQEEYDIARMLSEYPGISKYDPMLGWCWANVVDGGPASNQHWVNV